MRCMIMSKLYVLCGLTDVIVVKFIDYRVL